MDEHPRHNHLTRDIKQDGSCPACVVLLAQQHGSLAAAEAERQDWLSQACAAEQELGADPDPQDSEPGKPGS
jgi:hypothetical protein